MQLIVPWMALSLVLPALLASAVLAGGLEGRIGSRIVGNTTTENITNGYRNINLLRESRSSWSGETTTSQTTSNMTLQLDGFLTSSLVRIEENQFDLAPADALDSVGSSASGLSHNLVRLENPLINVTSSTGSSQTRITASGTDYSWMNAHTVDSYNSSSMSSAFGGESSTFGQTF